MHAPDAGCFGITMTPTSSSPSGHSTAVTVTVLSARDLHNTKKLFGRTNPTAVVSVASDPAKWKALAPAIGGETNPTWTFGNTAWFEAGDAYLQVDSPSRTSAQHSSSSSSSSSQQHQQHLPPPPPPCAVVEIFSSPSLRKSIGFATVPLEPAVRRFDEPQEGELPLFRRRRTGEMVQGGWVMVRVVVGRTGFAPPKGTAVYEAFRQMTAATPPPLPPAPLSLPPSAAALVNPSTCVNSLPIPGYPAHYQPGQGYPPNYQQFQQPPYNAYSVQDPRAPGFFPPAPLPTADRKSVV